VNASGLLAIKYSCVAGIDAGTLRDQPAERFFDRLGEHINELNAIHAFRDGNGRTMRAHAKQIAREAGHEIDPTRIDRAR
jgi:cell filamentation protein